MILVDKNGGEIVVLHKADSSPEEELTEDLLAILHVFSCRAHGRRRYVKKESAGKDFPNGAAGGEAAELARSFAEGIQSDGRIPQSTKDRRRKTPRMDGIRQATLCI